MEEAFLKRLFSTVKCGLCGQSYEAENINILGHQKELWFLNVACTHCQTQGLIAAVVKQGIIGEVITDLVEQEYAKFAQGETVGIDDVLDMHNSLKDFQGDLLDLFSER